MAAKKILIVGNWKMYVETPEEAKKFAAGLRRKAGVFGAELHITPPFTLLPVLATAFKNSSIKIGAQYVSPYNDQKRTGEVSAAMVKAAGANFTLVGHSERRGMGETNTIVRAELEKALAAGLTAVLCIGESERDPAGAYLSVITEQISSALDGLELKPGRLMVAYEPVWAIGKSAQDALGASELREMSIFIKKTLAEHMLRALALKVPILYGGSVEAGNARLLIDEGDVSGLLVGHASAQLEPLVDILKMLARK